jgi:hypothetical protein
MQEQLTLQLTDEFVSKYSSGTDILKKELSLQLKAIESLLVSYHFRSRGRVYNVQIIPDSIELLNPSMGKFVATYTIGQFNACADVDFNEQASMEILIDLNLATKTGIITGEYIPEREPDEL